MSNSKVKVAFEPQVVTILIEHIHEQKELSRDALRSIGYKRVKASLEHIGLIEPLVVFPRKPNDYLLLDGHIRLDVLKKSGASEVRAIFALDDEAYTYNRKVNRVYAVAEHTMILKALSSGVSEHRLAQVLHVDIGVIRLRRDMLDGICPEAVNILRNSAVKPEAFVVLKKMKPTRQIEAAEYMHATNNYSVLFAKSLLAMTHPDFLSELGTRKSNQTQISSIAAQEMMKQETDSLLQNLKSVEQSYGTDILTLAISCGYVARLLRNVKVERYLEKHHPDILVELRSLLSEVKPEMTKEVLAS